MLMWTIGNRALHFGVHQLVALSDHFVIITRILFLVKVPIARINIITVCMS